MAHLLIWNGEESLQCSCESHSEGIGDYYNAMICPECHVGTLLTHPELERWLKCTLCGFSTVETAKLSTLEEIIHEQFEEMQREMEEELQAITDLAVREFDRDRDEEDF